jgi:Mn2+/Fe2+ NRAMP family transporter
LFHNQWATLVAILGTTISPYLFFWQAAEEVEEEKKQGERTLAERRGATRQELIDRRIDVGVGAFFSNLVMYFIILTTALTLYKHGITHIETSAQAAAALRPLAGSFAATLYTLGILGVGFLSIPTLSGSAAYAFSETFSWRHGLEKKFRQAPYFYGIIIVATLLGVGMNFVHISPVQALFWSAVINGVLAPFLLLAILFVACDSKLMNNQPSSMLSRIVVGLTTLAMFAASIAMFIL